MKLTLHHPTTTTTTETHHLVVIVNIDIIVNVANAVLDLVHDEIIVFVYEVGWEVLNLKIRQLD